MDVDVADKARSASYAAEKPGVRLGLLLAS